MSICKNCKTNKRMTKSMLCEECDKIVFSKVKNYEEIIEECLTVIDEYQTASEKELV